MIAGLTGMLDRPTYRWVTPDVVAGIMKCSAETIRRQCRTETAPFLFEQDEESGRYRIWLASVPGQEAAQSATPTESSTEGYQP